MIEKLKIDHWREGTKEWFCGNKINEIIDHINHAHFGQILDSKPECGEKDTEHSVMGLRMEGKPKDQLMRIPLTLDEMSDLYEQKKMPHEFMPVDVSEGVKKLTEAYNKAVANGESNVFKPKEVEKCPDCEINGRVNCAKHGKPYKDCAVKPKDSLEELIHTWWKSDLPEYRSSKWYSKDLAAAIRKYLLERVEVLKRTEGDYNCRDCGDEGWLKGHKVALDDVKGVINEKE